MPSSAKRQEDAVSTQPKDDAGGYGKRKPANESSPSPFWEKLNTIAIYLSIIALFVILVLSSVSTTHSNLSNATTTTTNNNNFLQIGGTQILIIVVIAALLLFRYYNTVRIGTLLELANQDKQTEKDENDTGESKEDIKTILEAVEDAIKKVEEMIQRLGDQAPTKAKVAEAIKVNKESFMENIHSFAPMLSESNVKSKADIDKILEDHVAPRLEDILVHAVSVGETDKQTKEDLQNLKVQLEDQKVNLENIQERLDSRLDELRARRRRISTVTNELLQR